MNTHFYYTLCQAGAEKALKREILHFFPQLRFAFSRPGFVTFKEEGDARALISDPAPCIFTRLWGISLGQAKSEADLDTLMQSVPTDAILHGMERDVYVPGDEPEGFVRNAHIGPLLEKWRGTRSSRTPKPGDWVYDLVWIDDFHVHLGKHLHSEAIDPAPGNFPEIPLPEESPSRAYLKIEEAIHRFKPEVHAGMNVLEVGCSPGGATTAMLNRGMRVTGVDPKRMDPRLYRRKGFTSVQKMAQLVMPSDLKENPDWIVMDMNIAPLEAIDELSHVIQCLRMNFKKSLALKHGFLTIKLNDWRFADSIPLYLKRLEAIGFRNLRPTQLCSNRQEFFVYADFASTYFA